MASGKSVSLVRMIWQQRTAACSASCCAALDRTQWLQPCAPTLTPSVLDHKLDWGKEKCCTGPFSGRIKSFETSNLKAQVILRHKRSELEKKRPWRDQSWDFKNTRTSKKKCPIIAQKLWFFYLIFLMFNLIFPEELGQINHCQSTNIPWNYLELAFSTTS